MSNSDSDRTGNRPIKNDHPGVHPGDVGSKFPSAKETERRPAAASANKHIEITSNNQIQEDNRRRAVAAKHTDDA